MDRLYDLIAQLNNMVWSMPILFFFVATAIYVSAKLNWLQFSSFSYIYKNTLGKLLEKNNDSNGDISPFAALTTAMSSTLGVGTITGTATAIAIGGPGAVLWMMLAGIFVMAIKFSEITLAVHYRLKNDQGNWTGGPFSYIQLAFKDYPVIGKILGTIFTIGVILAALTLGNLIQGQSIAASIHTAWPVIPIPAIGVVTAIIVALVIVGGIKRIAAVAEKTVPTMALLTITMCLVAIIMNIGNVPAALYSIVTGALSGRASAGGLTGAAIAAMIRIGITRGILSNEAGCGTAPIAHASAKVNHPVKQGFWGVMEVFIDTHVVCLLIALVILSATHADGSLVWQSLDANGNILNGTPLIMEAMRASLPMGDVIAHPLMAIVISSFAITTIFGVSYYGLKGMESLFGTKSQTIYRLLFIPIVIVSSMVRVSLAFNIANIVLLIMVLPNLIAIIKQVNVIVALKNNYFANEKYVSYYEVTKGSEDVIENEVKSMTNKVGALKKA